MQRGSWRKLAVLLVLAFFVRLAAGWAWQSRLDGKFGMGDSESYWRLGQAIAYGQPYEYGESHARVFRTPGYPVLLAPIFWLAGDSPKGVLLARGEAALLGTLAVLGVWWLTRLLFDDRAALLAATLACFYPGAIVSGVLILSEAPFCPLMLLQLAFWTLAWNSPSAGRRMGWGFAAGLAAAAATLMRQLAAVHAVCRDCGNGGGLRDKQPLAIAAAISPLRHRILDAAWARRGDAAVVDSQRLRDWPLRAHDPPGWRQSVRRPESERHRGE